MDRSLEVDCVHQAVVIGDFFETSHFEALRVLNRADRLGGFQQRFVGTRLEPSVTAAENLNVQLVSVGWVRLMR
jgi:hypothetical protein